MVAVVKIEFDAAKDRANRRKHGVGLAMAAAIFETPYVEVPDDRFEYGEERSIAYGLIAGKVFTCVHTIRGDAYRIISLRKATRAETDAYHKAVGR